MFFCCFRQNFLNLDVYIQELSYQQITQQRAYELTNLWSKYIILLFLARKHCQELPGKSFRPKQEALEEGAQYDYDTRG